ncbi:hypothetical protein J7K93_07115 [bacterium]|nr:hypothetical protein [bacterium]
MSKNFIHGTLYMPVSQIITKGRFYGTVFVIYLSKLSKKELQVKDLAKKYNLTPMELFEKMKTVKKTGSSASYSGQGLGRKALKEVCEVESLDLEKSLQLLKNKGIDAYPEMTLRDIAEKYNLKPVDIMEIINPEK